MVDTESKQANEVCILHVTAIQTELHVAFTLVMQGEIDLLTNKSK